MRGPAFNQRRLALLALVGVSVGCAGFNDDDRLATQGTASALTDAELLAPIAIPNLLSARRRARYSRAASDTKTATTQGIVYSNDRALNPGTVTTLRHESYANVTSNVAPDQEQPEPQLTYSRVVEAVGDLTGGQPVSTETVIFENAPLVFGSDVARDAEGRISEYTLSADFLAICSALEARTSGRFPADVCLRLSAAAAAVP